MRLHADEVPIDAALVRRLVAAQLPHLQGLAVTPVPSSGTVNVVHRLGDRLCVRLPRVAEWSEDLDRELHWLPRLAPHLPLRVPEPMARGRPGQGYPFSWAVYGWLEGQPYADDLVDDEVRAARDLAGFVRALRAVPPLAGAPAGGRRPLAELDGPTREAIAAAPEVDGRVVTAAWERALQAPPWQGPPVWVHTDLLRPNLLVSGGRVHAVLDFGGVGRGDPAADVIAAWSVFGPPGRRTFRDALAVEEGTWERARGYALHQAVQIVPYYRHSAPAFVATALRTLEQVLTPD